MTFKPCLIIPTYNHYRKISEILEKSKEYELPTLIIDDGNSLEVASQLKSITSKFPHTTLLVHTKNKGKGAAVQTGFRWAIENQYSHIVQIDADGQHEINDIPKFLEVAKLHPQHLILGQPIYDETIPKSRFMGRYITHFWVAVETLTRAVGDTLCGFRVYPTPAVEKLLQKSKLKERMDFDCEVVVKLYWQKVNIKHINTKVKYGGDEASNFRMLKDNVLISLNHTTLVLQMIFLKWPSLLFRKNQ